jgi:hypothetical protein
MQDYSLPILGKTSISLITISLVNLETSKSIRLLLNGLNPFLLAGSKLSVKLATASSSWKKVNGGLPQGTKLGPILFAILTNSLLKDWQGRVKFVDDTTLLEIVPRCSPYYMSLLTKALILHRIGEWNLIQESARKWLYPSLNTVCNVIM